MLVEAKKKFAHGFLLNEADLRRTVDVVIEQFQKLKDSPIPTVSYELKYRNGAISNTESLDDVFNQENFGSAQIIRLKFSCDVEVENEQISIVVGFINSDVDEEPGVTSIWYNISGNSRDWVFVTSTLIQERIEKIKRFCPNQLGSSSKRGAPLRLFLPIFLMLFMFIPLSISNFRLENCI